MSRQRRNFSAKFKSDFVIEAIRGGMTINELAAGNNIQPNLLRNWKNGFLRNASIPTTPHGAPARCLTS